MRYVARLIFAVLLIALCSSCFGAVIVRVSPSGSDSNDGSSWVLAKKTIQAGVNTANTAGGGEVWVAAGVYKERVSLKANCYLYGGFAGSESTRSQRNFGANKSVIDGSGLASVVTSLAAATAAGIDGFTIRNGGAYPYGSVACTSSSPIIANNVIYGRASGVLCTGSSPSIYNNIICTSTSGIECTSSSRPTIRNNTITGANYGVRCLSSSSSNLN